MRGSRYVTCVHLKPRYGMEFIFLTILHLRLSDMWLPCSMEHKELRNFSCGSKALMRDTGMNKTMINGSRVCTGMGTGWGLMYP